MSVPQSIALTGLDEEDKARGKEHGNLRGISARLGKELWVHSFKPFNHVMKQSSTLTWVKDKI